MTINDIQDKVNTAKLYYLQQMALKLAKIRIGSQVSFKTLLGVKRLITGLTFQITADVIDSDTNTMYNCLVQALGGFGAPYNIDPEVKIPGQTVIEVPVIQNLNHDQLPINTTNESPQFILSNYQSNYAQLYGDNPLILQPYLNAGGFNTGDEQSPPIITRVDPNYPNSPILSILFDYPIATVGYLDIAGIGTISSGSPSSGGVVPIVFKFTQDDLIYDAILDQYYINLVLPGTKRPYYASINGDSIPVNYSASTSRFNGFANNIPTQNIEIDLM